MNKKEIWLISLFIIIFSANAVLMGDNLNQESEKSTYIGKVYFISTNNYGCECMKKRSRTMDDALCKIQEENNSIKKNIEVENIVFYKNQDVAMNILSQCHLEIPPAIILMDNENKILFKISYEFENKHIQILKKKIEKLLKREKKCKLESMYF